MCQSNLHFGGRPLLRSVIKRKSTNYNWQLNWRRDAAAANNTPKRTNGGRDSKESKQRDRFAVFRVVGDGGGGATGKMDYVTVYLSFSLLCLGLADMQATPWERAARNHLH